ncbi:MAG: hypothetical protein HOW73_45870 [Polyangiaceae bacterium]|nr:hypothetical protein [Polyangiaceae bacterium]
MACSIFARASLAAICASSIAALGCGDSGPEETSGVTYQRDVRPLIERSCTSCHTADGPTPYDFTYSAEMFESGTPSWAAAAVAAVDAGRMPPWMPADDCHELAYERRLTEDERAVFRAWSDNKFAVGDEADFVPLEDGPSAPDLGEPTIELTPEDDYVASSEASDDYRCFILPYDFDAETYVVGSTVVPGVLPIAHHALIYVIPPDLEQTIRGLDEDDEGIGYTCFGGPGGGVLSTLGGWVPGSVPTGAPADSAAVVPAGSKLVLQMHYNTLALGAGTGAPPDRTTVKLWTRPEAPSFRIESIPLAHLAMQIDAFDEASVQERLYRMPIDAKLVGVTPHMHTLGTQISVSHEPAGADAQCVVDIPDWDFHWQQQYTIPESASLELKKGDGVRVQCTYDNSQANQPLVDGMPRTPEDVTWGENTLDEMCLAYLFLQVPFDTPDFRCGAYTDCMASCSDSDGPCLFECATTGGGQCASCLFPAIFSCAPAYCAADGLALQSCVSGCEKTAARCIAVECGAEWDAFAGCMAPHVDNGDCSEQIAKCGL